MSDGAKGNVGQLIADIGEAVVKPVVDEVGKAIEEGGQSIAGTGQFSSNPSSPQEQQKKKLEEQKRKENKGKKKVKKLFQVFNQNSINITAKMLKMKLRQH